MERWRDGVVEWWRDGGRIETPAADGYFSSTPVLHYSNSPVLQFEFSAGQFTLFPVAVPWAYGRTNKAFYEKNWRIAG
jgi:hypothetical protein